MSNQRKIWIKRIFLIVLPVAIFFALGDSLGFFNPKEYTKVSHGSHFHYVPHDRDPNVGISRFPMTEPADDERITPTGQIVKKDSPP